MFTTGFAFHCVKGNLRLKNLLLLAVSLSVLIPAPVLANSRFTLLDLSAHFNQNHGQDEYGVFVSALPGGRVTFLSHIPFRFSRRRSVIIKNTSASLTVDATKAKAVHFLMNAGHALISSIKPGEPLGKITLFFDDAHTEVTQLLVGVNIREWRQAGDCGATVNTLTNPNASVEVMGKAPNACNPNFTQDGSGLAVIDRVTIPVRGKGESLTGIVVEDTNPGPATIFFSAVTIEVAQ